MSINKGLMSSTSSEWATPQSFFDELNKEFGFTLDPCCTRLNKKCDKYYTKQDDGLSKDWSGEIVFCNPPYGREIVEWVKKCHLESTQGTTVVMLIPARTDTSYFHDYIYGKHEIRFIRGRLHFNDSSDERCRMIVTISNNIIIKNPSKEILSWCNQHLTLNNPEYAKKVRMGFWVGNTPKHLFLYEVHGDEILLPYGTLKQIQSLIKGGVVTSDFKPFTSIDYGERVPLYDYQKQAVSVAKNGLYGIIQSKAGSGKTQMGIALIKEWGRRALWLTHTVDLLNQSKERAERYTDKSLIGTITEGKVNIGQGVTFATIQTMCKLDLSQYKDMWDVIIVDECHRVCGSPTQLTMFAKVLNSLSARHKYGLSATVHRADGMIQATFSLIGDVVYTVPDSAVADKVMQVGIKPIGTNIKLTSECLNTDGTLNYTKLINYLASSFTRNICIIDNLIDQKGKSCLVLSDRLEHLEKLLSMLPDDMRSQASMISGKMTTKKGKAEREQAIEDMRIGKKKYLFATYSLAKEGLDIPCLERLLMVTPQKDYAVITQSIGRIARTYEGKADPIVLDFVDDIGYLVKSYKKRCSTYRKNNCYFITEN